MVEKYILTGGPGSGKSSTIRVLEYEYGERTIAEAAEDLIKTLQKRGYEKPWELPNFQDKVLKLQLQREKRVEDLEGRVFIDRGILDGLAYYTFRKQNPSEAMKKAIENTRGRYKGVFLMELGDQCLKTGVRNEELEESKRLQELQFQNYLDADYTVIKIPYFSMEKRAELIIQILKVIGGKK